MYTIHKIESKMELPYNVIDIDTGNEHFILQFDSFDDNQSDYSIKMGGVTGKFSIQYHSNDINCQFECDITIGNVYAFYIALDTAYDILFGRNATAVLENYGKRLKHKHTSLIFNFDKRGHCNVKGFFKNASNHYTNGINFSFELDQIYITDILTSMEIFFRELKRIQGHSNFY